jgi:hypothetical protein
MDALLILSGLVLLLWGWGWLVFASVRLGAARLVLAVFLPMLSLILPRQGYPLIPRLLIAAGMLSAAAGIVYLHHSDRARYELLISGAWMGEPAAATGLSGRILGQRFEPDRVIWEGDELLFEEGPPDRVRRSLRIRFNGAQTLLRDRVVHKVPGDEGPWPELVLQWYEGAMLPPGLRKVSSPYSLSLRFSPTGENGVMVFINLSLGEGQATWLRGETALQDSPPWLIALEPPTPAIQPASQAPLAVAEPEPVRERWGELSVLALLDEPERFLGSTIRITTLSGRAHEGRFAAVTDERRIVLSQQKGPSSVDLQFNPVDIARLERLSSR